MSLEENFEKYFKEKYGNEKKEQNTETDNLTTFELVSQSFYRKTSTKKITRIDHQWPFRLIKIILISLNPEI